MPQVSTSTSAPAALSQVRRGQVQNEEKPAQGDSAERGNSVDIRA